MRQALPHFLAGTYLARVPLPWLMFLLPTIIVFTMTIVGAITCISLTIPIWNIVIVLVLLLLMLILILGLAACIIIRNVVIVILMVAGVFNISVVSISSPILLPLIKPRTKAVVILTIAHNISIFSTTITMIVIMIVTAATDTTLTIAIMIVIVVNIVVHISLVL